jgi:hypothetical protein
VSDDNTASRNYYKRIAQELAEAETPQARAQAILDRHWQSMRDLEFEDDDYIEIGGFRERRSAMPCFHKSRHDKDWRWC